MPARGDRIDPRNANLRFRTGLLLGRLERYQEAKAELEIATQVEPSYADAWILLCESCIRLKLAHEAQAAFEQAKRLRPDEPELKAMEPRIRALGGG